MIMSVGGVRCYFFIRQDCYGIRLTQATVSNVPVPANTSQDEFDELDMMTVRRSLVDQ